jgi:hypothetical protein
MSSRFKDAALQKAEQAAKNAEGRPGRRNAIVIAVISACGLLGAAYIQSVKKPDVVKGNQNAIGAGNITGNVAGNGNVVGNNNQVTQNVTPSPVSQENRASVGFENAEISFSDQRAFNLTAMQIKIPEIKVKNFGHRAATKAVVDFSLQLNGMIPHSEHWRPNSKVCQNAIARSATDPPYGKVYTVFSGEEITAKNSVADSDATNNVDAWVYLVGCIAYDDAGTPHTTVKVWRAEYGDKPEIIEVRPYNISYRKIMRLEAIYENAE